MQPRITLSVVTLIASLLCLPAMAQQGPMTGGGPGNAANAGGGPGAGGGYGRGNRDCSKAADPEMCQQRQTLRAQAQAACKDKAASERQQCMRQEMISKTDCSKSRDAARCEAHKKAVTECQGKTGPDFRQCVKEKSPPVDCSKARDPARCEYMQKALSACKDKPAQERKQCTREQMPKK